MDSTLSYLYEYTRQKRVGEEEALRPASPPSEPIDRCLNCGWPIEASKHSGQVYYFDIRTETLHVCRETLNTVMARVRRRVEKEWESESTVTLTVGRKRIEL